MKNTFFLILIICLSCKSKQTPLVIEYKNQALQDIQVDSVKKFTYGLVFISPIDKERKIYETRRYKLDSVYRKYGLFIKNIGCVIGDKNMDKATKEYYKRTEFYLEKRNGKFWKGKMEKEINNIIDN